MITLRTTTAVIDALGGNQGVADLLTDTKPSAVSNWRYFNKFPADTADTLRAELFKLGFVAPSDLWPMRKPTVKSRKYA